jgi:hypothetical protein
MPGQPEPGTPEPPGQSAQESPLDTGSGPEQLEQPGPSGQSDQPSRLDTGSGLEPPGRSAQASRRDVDRGPQQPERPAPSGQPRQVGRRDTGSRREQPNRREPADAAADDGQRGGGSQALYWIAACGVLLGLVWLRGGERYARSGTLVLAGVLLAAAVARLVLPDRLIGMLGSRGRLADVAALGALGGGLLVAGLVFPAPP